MQDILLSLENISKYFSGVPALQNINFELRSGEVHILMGENGAGKSTLMKIINGIYKADSGQMCFLGKKNFIHSPLEAQQLGISMIHQELNNVPDMTIAENLFLGREPVRFGLLDKKKMITDAQKLLEPIHLEIDVKRKMNSLSVAQMQMVEIAKAISYNAKVIIMDEPTSAISEQEVQTLFKVIKKLSEQGVGIIYISHKMDEVFAIGDRITVLRDGITCGTFNVKDTSRDQLITTMVGRELSAIYPPRSKRTIGKELLRTEELCNNMVTDISFSLRAGEILGIGGLMGAGRSELIESLFGLRKITKGKLYIHNKLVDFNAPSKAIKTKMALVTEDRKRTGFNPTTSIKRDMSIVTLKKFCKMNVIRTFLENKAVDQGIQSLNIKTYGRNQKVINLSGGNQQKVILARWLMAQPDIILLDEPTRGIDVGAKYEIYAIIQRLASEGKAVLIVSSELPEIIGICDRVLMMCEGRITGELQGKEMTQESMMHLATKRRVSQ